MRSNSIKEQMGKQSKRVRIETINKIIRSFIEMRNNGYDKTIIDGEIKCLEQLKEKNNAYSG